jgi:hypothetical protein
MSPHERARLLVVADRYGNLRPEGHRPRRRDELAEHRGRISRLANEFVAARLGGLHSAQLIVALVDFAGIEWLQVSSDWDEAGRQIAGLA